VLARGDTVPSGGPPRAPDGPEPPACLPRRCVARHRHDHAGCQPTRLRLDVPRGRPGNDRGHGGAAQGGPQAAARPGRLRPRGPRPRRAVGQDRPLPRGARQGARGRPHPNPASPRGGGRRQRRRAGGVGPVGLGLGGLPLPEYRQRVLAGDVGRYVGDPLAVVVAEDGYAAEDAAELVALDIEPMPPVLDAAAAAGPGAARLFPAGNIAADVSMGYGDADAAFGQAASVVATEIGIGRHTGVPLAPRALLAEPDSRTGGLSITGMTKVPVFNRDVLAGLLGIDETLIHVRAVDAGGGFGVRGEFYPEDYLVP